MQSKKKKKKPPRFVRPAFVTVSCADRASPVGIGPRDRSGTLSAAFTMRDAGAVVPALLVTAGGSPSGNTAHVDATAARRGVLYLPNGETVHVPAGAVLRFVTDQDPAPARAPVPSPVPHDCDMCEGSTSGMRPARFRCELCLSGCSTVPASRFAVLRPFTLAGEHRTGERIFACPACALSVPAGFVDAPASPVGA